MRNRLRALLLTALACLASNPAMADLAGGKREYAAGRYKEALAELQAPAMTGDGEAQALMGKIYLENYGKPRFPNAQYWLQKAVISGNEEARYYLNIVDTLIANDNTAMGHGADPAATVDAAGKVTAYRMVRMTVKVPPDLPGPLLSVPYYGRKEGILFGKSTSSPPSSTEMMLSALPYDTATPHASAEERRIAAERCFNAGAKAYAARVNHFAPGKWQEMAIAGMPATKLETRGLRDQAPLYGAAYCIAAPDQIYTFQVVQLGEGDHADADAAMHAVESAIYADK